jgi:hypothetical protein
MARDSTGVKFNELTVDVEKIASAKVQHNVDKEDSVNHRLKQLFLRGITRLVRKTCPVNIVERV